MHSRVAKIDYDDVVVPVPPGTIIPKRVAKNRSLKLKQLQRCHLDGRNATAKLFKRLANGVIDDLSPNGAQLSVVQQSLVEAFVGSAVLVDNLNARMLSGEDIDLGEYAVTASVLVRIASRLGVTRVPRLEPPDPRAAEREAEAIADMERFVESEADKIVSTVTQQQQPETAK
jgi:hypothetical protein